MKIETFQGKDKETYFYLLVDRAEVLANENIRNLHNYILQKLGDECVKYYLEHHKDEILGMLDKEKILEILTEKIKGSIKIGDPS